MSALAGGKILMGFDGSIYYAHSGVIVRPSKKGKKGKKRH